MSARDANARLSRRIREAQPTNDRLAAFRPGEHSELPQWPRDAFDPEPLEDSDERRGLTEEQLVLLLVLTAIIVAGLGLLYVAMR